MGDNYIQKIREESPTLQKKTFLNHASRGPLHGITQQAIQEYTAYWGEFDFDESNKVFQEARGKFGKLINAKEEEIVFTRDVASGSRLAANLIEYDEKSNVVCYWNDYVTQVYQALFLNKTKKLEYRPVPDKKNRLIVEEFANKIDKNTKLVLLSHVQWLSGCKADVKEITKIAHENEAFIVVDSIQSTGALINDVKDWDIDFLTCGTAKWLLGANQAGYFYMKSEYIDQFEPPFAGYHGVDPGSHDQPYWNVNDLIYKDDILKFMDTNPSDFLFYVSSKGMDIILEYGIENVEKRIMALTDYLIEELQKLGNYEFISPLEHEYKSGVVNIRLPDNIEIVKKLNERNIIVSSRYGGIRISPHFYNTNEDIDKLLDNLKQILT